MDDYEKKLEMLKLITSAEHHFNNLCFNIRALASTWLLAIIAGCGWILKDLPNDNTQFLVNKIDLITALSGCGALGIFVLWVLDLKVYQKLLNVWFDNRKQYEDGKDFPNIREGMKSLFSTGKATEYIKFYYMAICSAPLIFNAYIIIVTSSEKLILIPVLFVLLVINSVIYKLT